MAYTELYRINYSSGRVNIEEIYINGGAVNDVIKTRLSKPKYVSMYPAPNTATSHLISAIPAASLNVNARTATIQSFSSTGTPQLVVRFVGV